MHPAFIPMWKKPMPRLQQIYQGIRFSHYVNDLMQQVRHRYDAYNISSRLSSQRKAVNTSVCEEKATSWNNQSLFIYDDMRV